MATSSTKAFDIDFSKADEARAPSPEEVLLLIPQENLGPSEEDESEFAKELAKMSLESSADSKKVDKKTALALWDSTVLTPSIRKKRGEDDMVQDDVPDMMKFTVLTKRGPKQQVGLSIEHVKRVWIYSNNQTRQLALPAESSIAIHTRSAQLQDKAEQQHLKRFVLNYEQREEAEEHSRGEITIYSVVQVAELLYLSDGKSARGQNSLRWMSLES